MLFTDLGEYKLLFQDHILTVLLWVSTWGIIDSALNYFTVTANSAVFRILILIIVFILSSIALFKLSLEARNIERQELRELISEIRSH